MQIFNRLRHPVAASVLALVCAVTHAQVFARSQEANLIRVNTNVDDDKPNAVRGDLLRASDGNIYFASSKGGIGYGFIGKVAPDGTITTVYSFPDTEDTPVQPYGGLIQANDGNLYGTAFLGGATGGGAVFRLTLAGQYTLLHSFGSAGTNAADASLPYTALVQANDGNLYGTTLRGGANDKGTIFRLALDGTNFSFVHHFNGGNGENPEGQLIVGADGELYGTTLQGGSDNRGVIYRISTSGTFTLLYSFPSLSAFNTYGVAINATGANPRAGLLLAADGNYYGTAYQGGPGGFGSVFRMTPTGTVSVAHSFEGATLDGAYPLAGVTQDPAGNLYGTTLRGGHQDLGTAWRINTSGQFSLLHGFVDLGADGYAPYGRLLLANDSIYGASFSDATLNEGTLFKLDLGSNGALPVEISVSPTEVVRGNPATITWSSPTAATCTSTGAWNNDSLASGTKQVTPTVPGIYIYVLTCTDGAGVVRHAFATLIVTLPELDPVDGGGGAGASSMSLLLLLAVLLFRKNFRETATSCP